MSTRDDSATGSLLGLAVGDALGAGYEFGDPLRDAPQMIGGGLCEREPGEWTDDTAMAIVIADVAGRRDLRTPEARAEIYAGWEAWAPNAPDIGRQTRMVLCMGSTPEQVHAQLGGNSAGNGSLMRTAPVAIALLDQSEDVTATVARQISDMTHYDPTAGDACVLWCLAIRSAILQMDYDMRDGLRFIPDNRRSRWIQIINGAELHEPRYFDNDGWVVPAFEAAYSAVERSSDFRSGVEDAISAGGDTDTVGAIAGSLLGAIYGAQDIPEDWIEIIHGWPGMDASHLYGLVRQLT